MKALSGRVPQEYRAVIQAGGLKRRLLSVESFSFPFAKSARTSGSAVESKGGSMANQHQQVDGNVERVERNQAEADHDE